MEPTVCQAPIRDERQYRATSGEIQGTIFWTDRERGGAHAAGNGS